MTGMVAERLENVNPTRMELLEIVHRRRLAEKGHKLLTEKRDALVTQFFQLLDTRKDLREEVEKKTSKARLKLGEAETRYGTSNVTGMAMAAGTGDDIHSTLVSIMGVIVPHLEFTKKKTSAAYDPLDGGALLDEAASNFTSSLESIIRLAETEGAIERMAIEIEKTKRRVNALENIFIPRLLATERYISMQLEEREREDFFRRKRIKSIMERKAVAESAA